MIRVIVEKAINNPAEAAARINEQLAELGASWHVVSATTSLVPHGEMSGNIPGGGNWDRIARHIYFVTTVVVEKEEG